MPIGGVIINRVHQADAIVDETSYNLTENDLVAISTAPDVRLNGIDLTHRLLTAYREQLTLAALDRAAIEATDWSRAALPMHRVPHFDRDLHSLADVAAMCCVPTARTSAEHCNRSQRNAPAPRRAVARMRCEPEIRPTWPAPTTSSRRNPRTAARPRPIAFVAASTSVNAEISIDRRRCTQLGDDPHSRDVLRLSLRCLEVDPERTFAPPDQHGVCAVRQIELQPARVLRLTRSRRADRNRGRNHAEHLGKRATQIRT